MSCENLTPVQIGMTGKFAGKSYRVAGRIVMSMEEAGETYSWDEFHLIADDGSDATLVHELTERGTEWRLFTMFEPAYPMTAAEASAKRMGDTINVTGKTLRVTCVDESRVHQIEGEAPEGVEAGDIARYFNAEAGHEMIVVSWTGNEIEFYRGITLPGHVVMNAFGITGVPQGSLRHLGGNETSSGRQATRWIVGLVVFILACATGIIWLSKRNMPSRPKLPKAQLSVGQKGELNAATYRVTGRATVEVSHVGQRFLRHEYSLSAESGHELLLVQSGDRAADRWLLLTPLVPATPLTPREAGRLGLGSPVSLEGTALKVSDLFLVRVQQAEGAMPLRPGTELYGFVARAAGSAVMVRWTESTISFYRATLLPAAKTPWSR